VSCSGSPSEPDGDGRWRFNCLIPLITAVSRPAGARTESRYTEKVGSFASSAGSSTRFLNPLQHGRCTIRVRGLFVVRSLIA
jgi:hypothetical protein